MTADPVRAVRAGVERTGATVLLKGASQLVAGPDEDAIQVAVPGPAWTAQAGSGDVLGGVCAALLAAGPEPRRGRPAGGLGAGPGGGGPSGRDPPAGAGSGHRSRRGRAAAATDRPVMTAELDGTAPPGIDPGTASADIDLAAFRANIAALQDCVGSTALMVVVKADGYGHGILRCAAEARRAGSGLAGRGHPGRGAGRYARPGTPARCWPGCTGWRRT